MRVRKKMNKKGTIKERLTQAEKDIEQLAVAYRDLLNLKRNQAIRTLPTHAHEEVAEP